MWTVRLLEGYGWSECPRKNAAAAGAGDCKQPSATTGLDLFFSSWAAPRQGAAFQHTTNVLTEIH